MQQRFASAEDAVNCIGDEASFMIGGLGLVGIPEQLILALVKKALETWQLNQLTVMLGIGIALKK